ncbi:MAG: hypothetical protein AB1486_23615 [Planctomycetota bacterium]
MAPLLMGKTTRVLHNGHEFLLVDERHRGSPRTITCMVRSSDPTFDGIRGPGILPTSLGNWTPIGVWENASCRPLHGRAHSWMSTVSQVVDLYLEERRRLRLRSRPKRYWHLAVDSQIVFCFTPAHLHGLAIPLFSSRNAARSAAGTGAPRTAATPSPRGPASVPGLGVGECSVELVDDLCEFLASVAKAGFAGALLDETHPIFFCVDPSGNAHFLKIGLLPDTEITESLLQPDGSWTPYEGDPELELFVDQDACDALMLEMLGDIPFYGYTRDLDLYALYPLKGSEPLILPSEDERGFGTVPLFHEVTHAEEFMKYHDLDRHELRPVRDLVELLGFAAQRSSVVRLQPDAHRARGATLWLQDREIILDSFSGFWHSADGARTFTKKA